MCCSCNCLASGGSPTDDHGNPANITSTELTAAANASGISLEQVAQNIATSIATLAAPEEPAEPELVEKRLNVPPNPKRFVLGCAYPAARGDGHKEWASAETLEATAWNYAKQHRLVGFYHADGTVTHGDLVESYIHRGEPWVTKALDGTAQTIFPGDWMIGVQFDDVGFEQIVSEAVDGFSIDGVARRRSAPVPKR